MQGVRGAEHLPAPAPKEHMQGVQGARASASTSATGADARSAGARALLTPALQEQTRGCQPAWRSTREQCMVLVQTRDLSHDPCETHFCREEVDSAASGQTHAHPGTVPGCACVSFLDSLSLSPGWEMVMPCKTSHQGKTADIFIP